MEHLKLIDLWFGVNGPWLDALALFVVIGISLKLRNVICLIVLLDFGFVYVGIEHLRNSEYWPNVHMDYHYVLGIKDIILASILIFFHANRLLSLLYITGSVISLTTWYGYMVIYDKGIINLVNSIFGLGLSSRDFYDIWLYMFHAWSPIYFGIMVGQLYALSGGDSDVGKRLRNKILFNFRRNLPRTFYYSSYKYSPVTILGTQEK